MKVSKIKLIQKYLARENLYDDAMDGKRGACTDEAVRQALIKRSADFPEGWPSWPAKRQSIGYLQWVCHDNDIEAGGIDGFWGPQTDSAVDMLMVLNTSGALPPSFVDIVPIVANPQGFPVERESALTDYYGKHCEGRMVKVPCPWTLRLDWDLDKTTNTILIHEKLSDSLTRVLAQVFETYGAQGIRKYGLDRYGGSYNCRKKRGSNTKWSTHSWGCAIDWFPSQNRLKWRCDQASLARHELEPWWEIWEKEGWLSLGRSENRDWMHVQAAKR
jgi:hypothetical protein